MVNETDLLNYAGKRVLLTGHTGFKGSWLSVWLNMLGSELTGYALSPPTSPSLFDCINGAQLLQDHRSDIRDADSLQAAVANAQPEIVFHLAAQPLVKDGYKNPRETFDVNIGGTVNLLEELRTASESLKCVIVITTDKCYENREWVYAYREPDALGGRDPYSASKAAVEIICSAYARSFFEPMGIPLATARAGNIIGGGDWADYRIVPDLVRAAEGGQGNLKLRNPSARRPWQHVLDPLYGYLLLGAKLLSQADNGCDSDASSNAWNFAPSTLSNKTVLELVRAFQTVPESPSSDVKIEMDSCENHHEAQLLNLSSEKAYHKLGWTPGWDFETSVRKTAAWYSGYAKSRDAYELCRHDIEEYTHGHSDTL